MFVFAFANKLPIINMLLTAEICLTILEMFFFAATV